mmetsp:Transcript_43841/g.115943  ORF Transcript_43841/g.115943 Transcript_43841/m.115943 type:complete len:347 (-) Transcript_43841:7-1047(-)
MPRRQPPEDRRAFRVHRLGKRSDGRRQVPGLRGLAVRRRHGRPRQRGPEAVEALLIGHEAEHVDVVLGVQLDQPPEDVGRLAEALEVHAEAPLHLKHPELVHDLLLVIRQALQGLLELPGLLHDGRLVHEQLGVLVRDVPVVLEGLLVVVDARPRKLVALAQVLGDGVTNPVQTLAGFDLQELPPCLGKPDDVPAVDLQKGQISEDLDVLGVKPQCLTVALHGLLVVPVLAVEQAVDVPADVAPDVVLDALPRQLVGLLLPVQVAERQALHAQRLAMLRMLLQDRVRSLDALLVLLGLVELHDRPKHRLLLRRELLHGSRPGREAGPRRSGLWQVPARERRRTKTP